MSTALTVDIDVSWITEEFGDSPRLMHMMFNRVFRVKGISSLYWYERCVKERDQCNGFHQGIEHDEDWYEPHYHTHDSRPVADSGMSEHALHLHEIIYA